MNPARQRLEVLLVRVLELVPGLPVIEQKDWFLQDYRPERTSCLVDLGVELGLEA